VRRGARRLSQSEQKAIILWNAYLTAASELKAAGYAPANSIMRDHLEDKLLAILPETTRKKIEAEHA